MTSTRSAPARSGPVPPPPTEGGDFGHPLFVLNLKSYPSALGKGAVVLAKILADAGAAAGVPVAVAPAAPDLGRVAASVRVPVIAQHVDPIDAGQRTGYVPVEAVRAAGARGSLVNHSEHPIPPEVVDEAVRRLRELELVAIVCAADTARARRLAESRPPYLAVEPPGLIGGDRAVSTAAPELISETVAAVRSVSPETRVLCGAGIHGRGDVARALELGSQGILVASAVTLARDPRASVEELLAGF